MDYIRITKSVYKIVVLLPMPMLAWMHVLHVVLAVSNVLPSVPVPSVRLAPMSIGGHVIVYVLHRQSLCTWTSIAETALSITAYSAICPTGIILTVYYVSLDTIYINSNVFMHVLMAMNLTQLHKLYASLLKTVHCWCSWKNCKNIKYGWCLVLHYLPYIAYSW